MCNLNKQSVSINCRPEVKDAAYWAKYRGQLNITHELIEYCRMRAREGRTAGDIAHEIKWPEYRSIRQIVRWIDG